LKKGYALTEFDVTQKKVKIDSIKNTRPIELEQIVGKALTQSVKTGQIIDEKDLRDKPIINQNQHINIVFIKRNLTIEASGIALESGALGEVIKVKNIDNNKILKGWVSDENTVTVNKDAR
jgi:flagella basal body P-ring formation protein FlgA